MKKHLAIFSGNNAELILNGQKTIETRFSKSKIVPFGGVSAGDIVYVKPAGGDIIGQFRVKKVISYDGLDYEDLINIEKIYNSQILSDQKYWQQKKDSKYGTLIFIEACTRFITSPIKVPKRDQRGWMVLE